MKQNFTRLMLISAIVLLTFNTYSQTSLIAGDIAFSGYKSDDPDVFSFILLTDVAANTTIRFTDNGWKSNNTFRTGEGIELATFTTAVSCGAEIFANPGANTLTIPAGGVGTLNNVSGSFALSIDGDQILAYQGTEASPTFISATNFNGNNPWDADATNSNTSAIPMGLVNGVNAVGHGEVENGRYECFNPISGTIATLRSAFNNTRNWTKSDSPEIITVPSGCAYSISDCGPCAAANAVCNNTTVQLNASGMASIMPSDVGGGSTAECGLMTETVMPMNFDCQDISSSVSATYTITDVNGAASSCTATVTVEDNIAPTAGCTNVTVQLDASGNGSATAAAVESGSSDNCGTVNTVSLVPNTFDCGDIGPNTVTLTVNDGNGNTSSCTATATVEDNIAPMAGCQNVIVQLDASGNGSATAAAVESGSSDNCGTVNTVSLVPNAFDCGDIGPNTVTLTVNDGNGNTSSCTTTATVEDNMPPTPVCKTTTVELNPDNGMYTLQESDVYDANASTDNCSIDDVSFAATTYDCDDEDQTFTVTVTVTDAGGNMVSCNASITVIVGGALPSAWSTNDVGDSGTLGNDYYFDPCEGVIGEFEITGGGQNATGSTTDNVAFASQFLCGNNVTITAKIESVDPNGYGGLMIRETTAAGAKQVAIFSNLTYVLRHETRYTTNGMKQINSFFKPSPTWLRLTRMGNWIFAYYSDDGMSFDYVHGVPVPMNSCVEYGLASFTYNPGQQTTTVFSNVSITGGNMPIAEVPTIAEVETSKKLPSLYPNPSRDIANLVFENGLEKDASVILRNQLGQVVEQRQLRTGDFNTEWNVSSLVDGLYLFEIRQEGEAVQVLRLVKTQ